MRPGPDPLRRRSSGRPAAGRPPGGPAPKTSRSRSSSRGPQRPRTWRPNARSSAFSATSSAIAPVAGSGPARDVERDDRVAELRLVGDADRLGRVQPRDAAQPDAGQRRQGVDRRARASRRHRRRSPRGRCRPASASSWPSRRHLRPSRSASLDSPGGRRRRHHPPPAAVAGRRSARAWPGRRAGRAGRPATGPASSRRAPADGADRRRRPRRPPVRRPTSARCSCRARLPGAGSSCSGRGRCRSRRRPTARRSSRRLRPRRQSGPGQQPLLGGCRGAVGGRGRRPGPAAGRVPGRQRPAALARRGGRGPAGRPALALAAGGRSRLAARRRSSSTGAGDGSRAAARPGRSGRVERIDAPLPGDPPGAGRSAGRAGRRRADLGGDDRLARAPRSLPGPRPRRGARAARLEPARAGRPGRRAAGGRPGRSSGWSSTATGRRRSARGSPSWATRRSSTAGSCSPIGWGPTRRAGRPPGSRFASDLLDPSPVDDSWLARADRGGRRRADPGPARRALAGRARRPAGRAAEADRRWTRSRPACGRCRIREPLPVDGEPRLVERIRAEIARDGPITFARFMDLALYEPDLGYYRSAAERPGRAGDFLTAPETHPIFGAAIARQLDEVHRPARRSGSVRRPRARRGVRDARAGRSSRRSTARASSDG